MNNTSVTNLDWKDAISSAKANDFVFLDPPYTRVFTKYHPDGSFGKKSIKIWLYGLLVNKLRQ
jgi:site-specific DNA-adenine methylase